MVHHSTAVFADFTLYILLGSFLYSCAIQYGYRGKRTAFPSQVELQNKKLSYTGSPNKHGNCVTTFIFSSTHAAFFYMNTVIAVFQLNL